MVLSDPKTGKNAFGLFSNTKLEIITMFALACIGILIKLCFNTKTENSGQSGSASATIWGYGLSSIALISLLFINIGLTNKEQMNKKELANSILDFIKNSAPSLLLIGILISIIILNYNFYKRINIGKIPIEFTSYSFISSLLLIIQMVTFYQYVNITMLKGSLHKVSVKESALETIMYLLSVLNFIFIVIMYILLHFYTTDG